MTLADLKYHSVTHDHQAFLVRASKSKGFAEAYDALDLEYQLASQMLKARDRADVGSSPIERGTERAR